MRIGLVSYWFNRGQATVARYLRSALERLGHETFVLARPTKDTFVRPCYVSGEDVWHQGGVTVAKHNDIPAQEYLKWASDHALEMVFFDQNYQFSEIAELHGLGIVTIGRFVWESFGAQHVSDAREAFSVIYSLTHCEQERYRTMGIDSPYIPWGCHPELVAYRNNRPNQGRDFFYVGGFLSKRKPTGAVVEAFRGIQNAALRLTIKSQRALYSSDILIPKQFSDLKRAKPVKLSEAVFDDPRIRTVQEDMQTEDYYMLYSDCDVSVAPSRWEGLGLHLYEALAFGVPTISCDIPPINEVIRQGIDGILVPCRPIGRTRSGLTAYDPEVSELRRAMVALSDPKVAQGMADNTAEDLEHWSWDRTVTAFGDLITSVS